MEIRIPHKATQKKVEKIKKEIKKLGAPTIRVRDIDGLIYAMEGVHRLTACTQLDICPILDYKTSILDTDLNTEWAYADTDEELIDHIKSHDIGSWEKIEIMEEAIQIEK